MISSTQYIHSFNKHSLNIHHMPGILLTKDTKRKESRFLVFKLQVVTKRVETCK